MKFISLCSGIEAASVAFAPLGWEAIGFSEIEPFPCAVLAHHYPHVPNFGDMTKFRDWPEQVFMDADVIVGGPPCQAFSIAGSRKGLADARGNLTLIYVELINHADKIRQKYQRPPVIALYENVPGLLSDRTNAFGCLLGALSGEDDPVVPPGKRWTDAGAVFGPERAMAWRVYDAQYFALAQRRRRVFVVASARDGFDPCEVLFEFDGVRRDSAPRRDTREEVTGTISSRTTGGGGLGTDFELGWGLQPVAGCDLRNGAITGEVAHTIQEGVHAPDPGGTPHVLVRSVALRGREGGATAELGDDVAGCLRASTGGGDKPHVLAPIAFDCKASGQSGFGVGEIASTMRAMGHAASHQNGGGHLAVAYQNPLPGESSNDYWQRMTDYERKHGIDPTAGSEPFPTPVCVTGDISHTLKAEGFDASEDGTGRGQPIVNVPMGCDGSINGPVTPLMARSSRGGAQTLTPWHQTDGHMIGIGMAVRRLTPRECARLQGFPDDYLSQVIVRGKPAADGPMYKALGNSWAATNVRWIGARIDRQLKRLA